MLLDRLVERRHRHAATVVTSYRELGRPRRQWSPSSRRRWRFRQVRLAPMGHGDGRDQWIHGLHCVGLVDTRRHSLGRKRRSEARQVLSEAARVAAAPVGTAPSTTGTDSGRTTGGTTRSLSLRSGPRGPAGGHVQRRVLVLRVNSVDRQPRSGAESSARRSVATGGSHGRRLERCAGHARLLGGGGVVGSTPLEGGRRWTGPAEWAPRPSTLCWPAPRFGLSVGHHEGGGRS